MKVFRIVDVPGGGEIARKATVGTSDRIFYLNGPGRIRVRFAERASQRIFDLPLGIGDRFSMPAGKTFDSIEIFNLDAQPQAVTLLIGQGELVRAPGQTEPLADSPAQTFTARATIAVSQDAAVDESYIGMTFEPQPLDAAFGGIAMAVRNIRLFSQIGGPWAVIAVEGHADASGSGRADYPGTQAFPSTLQPNTYFANLNQPAPQVRPGTLIRTGPVGVNSSYNAHLVGRTFADSSQFFLDLQYAIPLERLDFTFDPELILPLNWHLIITQDTSHRLNESSASATLSGRLVKVT